MTHLAAKLAHYLEADETLRKIYNYTHMRFDSAPHLTAHNWEHIYRDTLNAVQIGEAEHADMAVVLPAIIMHDMGFLYGATGQTHGAVGAEILAEFLQEGDIILSADQISHIGLCIRSHKGSMHGEQPETLEAKVVSDADLLEKFGTLGIYQTIRTFTEFNYDAATVIKRLSSFEELTFQTATGKKLAADGRQTVVEFGHALAKAYQPYREESS